MTPDFENMKKHADEHGLPIDMDKVERDWEAYMEIEEEEIIGDEKRTKSKEIRYKKGGSRRTMK